MAIETTLPDLLTINGVKAITCEANIRYKNRHDLVVMELCEGSSIAAVFTQNAFCAAPVVLAKQQLLQRNADSKTYLLINAGNANAGTGSAGMSAALKTCEYIAEKFDVSPEQVLPFSTGVIGEQLPLDKFSEAISTLNVENLKQDVWFEVAQTILTTDTKPKAKSLQWGVNGVDVCLTGVAKGSGMIKPNMATMLAYMATDIAIDETLLQELLQDVNEQSFNCITVDGDTSTNDAFILIATGKSGVKLHRDDPQFEIFKQKLIELSVFLAQEIVRDGEGATKFIEISVEGGVDRKECKELAYTIAHSPLVKTAFFASDPNWGRILAAVGRAPLANLDLSKVDIELGTLALIRGGEPASEYTEEKGQTEMKAKDITIKVQLNRGEAAAKVWTCDFSYDYVKINAEYRS